MNKRTQKSYEAVFEFINSKVFDMNGAKMFITDYEKAMRNALKSKFSDSEMSACHFHFAQAIRKKASKIQGLTDFLKTNELAESLFYKLMYIPLLPANEIESTFDVLRNDVHDIDNDGLNKFIRYFERQWIVKEGPGQISVYDNEMRTTSPAEGFNRNLNEYCAKKGSFIWFCSSIRNQEFMKAKEFAAYIKSGGLVGDNKKKSDKVFEFIHINLKLVLY